MSKMDNTQRNRAARIARDLKAKERAALLKAIKVKREAQGNVLSTYHEQRRNKRLIQQSRARNQRIHIPRCYADLREMINDLGGSLRLSF
jgi:hypothetical protein